MKPGGRFNYRPDWQSGTHDLTWLKVVIISWTGYEESAREIELALQARSVNVTVVHNPNRGPAKIPGHWHLVPKDCFFGCMFELSLPDDNTSSLLQIHADAVTEDWFEVVDRFAWAVSQFPHLGVWGPDLDFTPHSSRRVKLPLQIDSTHLLRVTVTDGIVWGITPPVIQRLRAAKCSVNSLGWGIDRLASAFCYSSGLLVLRDRGVQVDHPKATSYNTTEARHQMRTFLGQLSIREGAALLFSQMTETWNRFQHFIMASQRLSSRRKTKTST